MYGRALRAVGLLLVSPLLAGILSYALAFIIPAFEAPNSNLASVFTSVQEHTLILMILSILVYVIAGAVAESRGGALG